MPRLESIAVLDTSNLIYRSLHVRGPDLQAPDGTLTKGPWIFLKTLMKVMRRKPSYLVATADTPRDQLWRREWFPAYKTNRGDAPPEEISEQVRTSWEIVRALGIPVIKAERWEADDVIATLARYCPSDEVQVEIVGTDKDMHQLLSDRVVMWDPWKETRFTAADAEAKWGVPVEKIPLVQSMMGDTADGIPGIADVGPKTAAKWVLAHDTWQNIVISATMGNFPEKLANRICLAQADGSHELMMKLVTLNNDLSIPICERELAFDGPDYEGAAPLFEQLGFRSLGGVAR